MPPTIADVRKCAFCGKRAYCYESAEDVANAFNQNTGEFFNCLFDAQWEICKYVGDENLGGVYLYWHDGRAVGRFRELN